MTKRLPTFFLLALLAAGALGISSCGDDNGPTNPGTGGNPPPAKELDSGTFGPGASYSHVFGTAGVFPYHCELHPTMTGSVTVAAGGDSLVNVSIVSNTDPFAPATVRPGGRVTWTNNTNMPHTVTSN